jgi:hypothetical protein
MWSASRTGHSTLGKEPPVTSGWETGLGHTTVRTQRDESKSCKCKRVLGVPVKGCSAMGQVVVVCLPIETLSVDISM